MAVEIRGTEELLLRIVKYVILVLMAIALLAIPVSLMIGGVNLSSQPKEPAPAEIAPAKDVTAEGLQNFLLDVQKRQDDADNFDPSKKKASEQDQTPAQYLENAVKTIRCLQKFAVAAEISLPVDYDSNADAMKFRTELEGAANRTGRGEPYVNSLTSFICKIVADPAIVALKKESKFKGSIRATATLYHRNQWDRLVTEKNSFDAAEKARVAEERGAEALRIAADRAKAIAAFSAAGAAFLTFMLLALYLIMTKIETNMRDINDSLKQREEK